MIEINLYKNYNLSLADIHRQQIQGVSAGESKLPAKGKKKLNNGILIVLSSLALVVLILMVALIYKHAKKKPVPEPQKTEAYVYVPPVINVPKSDYKIIHILEFDDTTGDGGELQNNDTGSDSGELNSTVTVPEKNDLKAGVDDNLSATAATKDAAASSLPNAKDVKQVSSDNTLNTPPVINKVLYSVEVKDLDAQELESIKGIFQVNKVKFEITEIQSRKVWALYKRDENGTTIIDGFRVSLVAQHETQQEALDFALLQDYDSIIKLTDNNNFRYIIRGCCMELDKAKNFIYETGITDKIFTVRKDS